MTGLIQTTDTRVPGAVSARPSRRWRFGHGLAAVVALALIVRVLLVLVTPQFVPRTDSSDYDRIAVSLAQTGNFPVSVLSSDGGPTAFRPPMFPLALAGAYKLVGTDDATARWEAGRLLEALLGAIAVGLICLIAARLWGPVVALVAGVIASVEPPLLLAGSSLMTESLFIPLVLAAVLCGLVARERDRGWRWVVLSGVLVGLATLTRSNGIVLLLPVGFLVWTGRPRFSWRAVRVPLLLIAAIALTLTPWTIRNLNLLHEFVPISTESGVGFAGIYNDVTNRRTDFPGMWVLPTPEMNQIIAQHPRYNEAQFADALNGDALRYVEAHPFFPAKVALWSGLRLFNLTGTRIERVAALGEAYPPHLAVLSVYAFLALAVVALFGATTRRARRPPPAFWACPAMIVLSTLFIIGVTRYREPVDPFVIMLAALGLVSGWERMRARRVAGIVSSG